MLCFEPLRIAQNLLSRTRAGIFDSHEVKIFTFLFQKNFVS